MGRFKYKLMNFMQGRYGADDFHKFLMIAFIIIWILNIIIKNTILNYLGLIIAIFSIYRMFSRNIFKRQKENMKYLKIKEKLKNKYQLLKRKWNDRNTHIYRKCPNCKSNIRLPKKKGTHTCACPCCKNEFKVKC